MRGDKDGLLQEIRGQPLNICWGV